MRAFRNFRLTVLLLCGRALEAAEDAGAAAEEAAAGAAAEDARREGALSLSSSNPRELQKLRGTTLRPFSCVSFRRASSPDKREAGDGSRIGRETASLKNEVRKCIMGNVALAQNEP